MPTFNVLNGVVSFDREVTLRKGVNEEMDHPPATAEAPVTYTVVGYRSDSYVQLWSAPVNIRAHKLRLINIGNIKKFGWVNIITVSKREWVYGNGHVVKESIGNVPTWDTTGEGPWYQEGYWSTYKGGAGKEEVEEDEQVESVFFDDQPNSPPYPDEYEHNGIPLGRLNYYSPQK